MPHTDMSSPAYTGTDLLIADLRNHYPGGIESTIQQIAGGRVAAIAADDDTKNVRFGGSRHLGVSA
jgi:hypothetical protein